MATVAESEKDKFYACLYRGLYAEAMNDPATSERWIKEALTHKIKTPPADFLYMLARIHHARRPPATERGARLSDVIETRPAEEPTFDISKWKKKAKSEL